MADKREIKTTLALDGEKQFKAAMEESYRGLKVLGSEMKLNTAIFGDNAKSMEGLTNKGQILGKEIAKQKEIIETITRALKEAEASYGENSKEADAYKIKLNNASAALVRMEGELKQNNSAIDNFGKSAAEAGAKTSTWRDSLEKMNSSLQSGINAIKPIAAGIAAIGTAAIAAGTQIFGATVETGKLADELITLSNQTGVSTQTLQEWTYAAQFIDTEVETMTGSMAKMIRQMDAAKVGTSASAQAFSELGIKVTDSSGQLLNSQTVFFQAIDALSRVANETERDALAMQLFGKSAQELNPLIIAGSAELQRLGVEAQNVGAVMSDQTITAFGAFDDSMNTLNSTVGGVKNSFLTALLPAIQSIIPVVQDVAVKFGEWLRSDGAQAMLASLGDKIRSVASWLSENMSGAVDSVIKGFETVTSTLGWVIQNFDSLVTVGEIIIVTLAALKVAQLAFNIALYGCPINWVVLAITGLVAAIVLLIKNWDNVKKAVVQVWDSIKNTVAQGIKGIEKAFQAVIDWFGNIVKGIWNIGSNIVKGIWDGISGAYQWIKDKISGWVGGVLDWIKGLFGIHSPSSVMRDMIGKPMVQGMALGIEKNGKLVDDAMTGIVPETRAASMALNVTRRFNDVASDAMNVSRTTTTKQVMELSDSAVNKIVRGFKSAISEQGDPVIVMDGRELGRAVRKVQLSPA